MITVTRIIRKMIFMRKKKTITIFVIVLFCLASSLHLQNSTIVNAASGSLSESFSSTTFLDAANTNATGWGTGLVKNPDKANPELSGFYNSTKDPVDVFVEGDYAYTAEYHGDLAILDISDPTTPTSVSNYSIGVEDGTPTGVYVVGSECYVATRNWGLQIVEISDPYAPGNASAYDTIDHPRDVFVSSGFCYIADEAGGVQIVLVTNPANPTNVTAINVGGHIYGVYVVDSMLYFVDYFGRFFIYDVTTPMVPVYQGNVTLPNNAYDLSIDGNTAYIACGWAGLVTIDITTSTAPVILDTYNSGDNVKDAKFEDNKVYITDSMSGVIVIDADDPSDLQLIGSYDTWNWPDGLFVKDKFVYVTDYFGGFLILDHTGYESPVVAQSTTLITVTDETQIVEASILLTNYSTLWAGMAIVLYLSADDGANWLAVTHGVLTAFTNPGTQLKFKLLMICNNIVNTTWVSELTIDYTTVLDETGLNWPSINLYTRDNTPTLTWDPITGASNYLLQIDSSGSWVSPEFNVTVGSATFTTTPLTDDRYYWRVAGIDSQGDLGVWSTTWFFNIDTVAPGQTDLMLPANMSSTNDATPLFEWWSVAGADFYFLQGDNNSDYLSPEIMQYTTATSFALTTPLADNSYYWRVKALDTAGNQGAWSETWVINIDTIGPNSPLPNQPPNDTITQDSTPTLQTDITAEAVEWNYQISTSDTFGTLVENVTEASNGWTVVSPLSDGIYFWRVRAGDSLDNWSPWSAVWTFTIDTTEPIISNPIDFSYDEGATGYNISWVIAEINQYTCEVYLNNVAVDSGLLTLDGDTLSITVDGLPVGSHNYTLAVTDSVGNFAVDTVIVTVSIVISEFNPSVLILTPVTIVGICMLFVLKRCK